MTTRDQVFDILNGETVRPYSELIDLTRRAYVEVILAQTGWNVTQAAKLANMDRSNFRRLIHSAGLKRPPRGGR